MDQLGPDKIIKKDGHPVWMMVTKFELIEGELTKEEFDNYQEIGIQEESGIDWVNNLKQEIDSGAPHAREWWVERVYTDASIAAPLLALGLGINLTVLQAMGDSDHEGEVVIESQQYGLKGRVYKGRCRKLIGADEGEPLGALMSREKELIRALDRIDEKCMFMREAVHKEWVVLPRIQVMENIVEADDYADVFGRKLLIETSITSPIWETLERVKTKARTKYHKIQGREYHQIQGAKVQSAPIMSIAFVKLGDSHHFVNIRDVNQELQQIVENDSDGAKAEIATRIDEMFDGYRQGGHDVYTKAISSHRYKERKRRETEVAEIKRVESSRRKDERAAKKQTK
jgi:hypothetical protein